MVAGMRAHAATAGHLPRGVLPTAQWYSLEIGHVHVLQLDLDPYFCWHVPNCHAVDNCGFVDAYVSDPAAGPTLADFKRYRAELLAFAVLVAPCARLRGKTGNGRPLEVLRWRMRARTVSWEA